LLRTLVRSGVSAIIIIYYKIVHRVPHKHIKGKVEANTKNTKDNKKYIIIK